MARMLSKQRRTNMKNFIKDYGAIFSIILAFLGWIFHQAVASELGDDKLNKLTEETQAIEIRVNENGHSLNKLVANEAVQDQKLKVLQEQARKNTAIMEKLADHLHGLQITMAGVESELRANRELRGER